MTDEVAALQAIVAEQAMRIRQLEEDVRRNSALQVLRDLLQLSEVVNHTVGEAPYHALLNGIIEAAKRLFDAGAASIALLDQESGELVFVAAAEAELIGMRFPAHQGIAGWVMMTGEPIAVGDVRRDPRFAREFAAATGYVPTSIMAVPLLVGDEVEGVLSVLDKAHAASFGLDDMELLGLFARPAAIAVEQARLVGAVGRLLVTELQRLAEERGDAELAGAAETALSQGSQTSDRTIELARLVHTVGTRSTRGSGMAAEVLKAIVRFMA